MKLLIKQLFFVLKLEIYLDKMIFLSSVLKNRKKNFDYKKKNPNIKLPPDYYLYETYKLDYESYINDGEIVANEIVEWMKPYIPKKNEIKVLDWGCGVSRICRHIKHYLGVDSRIYGCDINQEMIEWGQKNLDEIQYSLIDYNPPTKYLNDTFSMVYGISIFTHINYEEQKKWFDEIHRILTKGGVFLFTTHGTNCISRLTSEEQNTLKNNGTFTRIYPQNGHRLMATYNTNDNIKKMIEEKYEILEFYEGEEAKKRTGEQDLWIIKKK